MNLREYQGQHPRLGKDCYVDPAATIIGDVILGDDVSIWPNVVLRGDVNKIRVGTGSNLQDNTVCHVNHASDFNPQGDPLIIGDRVTVGHRALLHACEIGDDCLIGMGAIVMDKVIIEPKVMVAAGSLVTPNKVLKSGYLYVGQPAKALRLLTAEEQERITYHAQQYIKLKNNYNKINGD